MRILDRYLLLRFVASLAFSLLSLVFVVVIFTVVVSLAQFIDNDVPQFVILKYFVFYVPYVIVFSLPLVMLLASLFSIGQLAKNNELLPMKSAGVSLHRTLAPVLGVGLLICVMALGFGEYVVPYANQERTRINDQYLARYSRHARLSNKNIFWRDAINRRVFIGSFDGRINLASKVTIQKYDGTQIVERYDAETMRWQDSTWVLLNGYQRTFVEEKDLGGPFEKYRDEHLNFTPHELLRANTVPDDMSYSELDDFIREVIRNGSDPKKWQVELYAKVSMPFAGFVMILFGGALASRRSNSGAIYSVILSVVIWLMFYLSARLVKTLAEVGKIPPFPAAWAPIAFFLIIGLLVLFLCRK